MRVVSMVPSWTETLLKAGVPVVGRTRFCIHPPKMITNIPIVGGTKDVSWELVEDLKPDLVLLDEEENPLEMAEECPVPYFSTHVSSLETLQKELVRLGEKFENPALIDMSVRCLDVIEAPPVKWNYQKIPGFLEWVKSPGDEYEKCFVFDLEKTLDGCQSRNLYRFCIGKIRGAAGRVSCRGKISCRGVGRF